MKPSRLVLAAALTVGVLSAHSALAAAPPDVQLSLPFNRDCIALQQRVVLDGDCDGNGITLVAESIPVGRLMSRGVAFAAPPVTGNGSVVAVGQTVPVPRVSGRAYLHVLAFATSAGDGLVGGTATVTYADRTTTKAPLKALDWIGKAAAGAVAVRVQNPSDPSNLVTPGKAGWFLVTIPVTAKKAITGITLPAGTMGPTLLSPEGLAAQAAAGTPMLHVVAMTLSNSTGRSGAVFN